MEFTTHFDLQSQANRLFESVPYAVDSGAQTGFSPSTMPCSKGLLPGPQLTTASIDYNSGGGNPLQIFKLSSSRFTRRY
jgi:hypothetical protein